MFRLLSLWWFLRGFVEFKTGQGLKSQTGPRLREVLQKIAEYYLLNGGQERNATMYDYDFDLVPYNVTQTLFATDSVPMKPIEMFCLDKARMHLPKLADWILFLPENRGEKYVPVVYIKTSDVSMRKLGFFESLQLLQIWEKCQNSDYYLASEIERYLDNLTVQIDCLNQA